MTGPVFVVLAGLSGAGKSTLRSDIVDAFRGEIVALSTDDHIEYQARRDGITYTEAFGGAIEGAERLLKYKFRLGALNRMDMILDRTSLSKKSRSIALAEVPSCYTRVCLVCQVDEEERERRLGSRPGKIIPPAALLSQKLRWEYPDSSENFHTIAEASMWREVLTPFIKA